MLDRTPSRAAKNYSTDNARQAGDANLLITMRHRQAGGA